MKKILILILVLTLLPVFAFAKSEVKKVGIGKACGLDYSYNWFDFLVKNNKHERNKGAWKYGYIVEKHDNNTYTYIPKKPKNYQMPSYLKDYLIVNENVSVSDFRKKCADKKDIKTLVMVSSYLDFESGVVYKYTYNNDWLVIKNDCHSHNHNFDNYRHDKTMPYMDARTSIMKTIMMHCQFEKRDPNISEKYIMLYLYMYGEELCRKLDHEYNQTHIEEYRTINKAEELNMFVIGPLRLVGWCLLILFMFALPGIILVILKFVFPKGSVIYSAVCTLELLLGIFAISYWYGNRR